MIKVFISGSIKIKKIDINVMKRLDNIIESNYTILVGDANGVDESIQNYLSEKSVNSVRVYCTGDKPRNNLGNWETENIKSKHKKGTRAYFTAKDVEMAKNCDYGFMVWDTRSTGTLKNTIELLKSNKKSLVYINKVKKFIIVKNISDFNQLISTMSETALYSANKKLGIDKLIEELNHNQGDLFNAA